MDYHKDTCVKLEKEPNSIQQAINYPKNKKKEENRNKINEKKIFGFESVYQNKKKKLKGVKGKGRKVKKGAIIVRNAQKRKKK